MTDQTPARGSRAPKFSRSLSGFAVIILTLSVLSPGASIFVSGGPIVQTAGSGAVFAFLLGGLVNYCQTSLSAELGVAYPTAGYDYAAIGHALGDWAGALTYIASVFTLPLFLNTSAVGIAIYLQPLLPHLDTNTVTFTTVGVVTALSLLNIRSSELITGLFMLIEVLALLLVAGLGVLHAQPGAHQLIVQPMHVENGLWVAAGIGALGLGVNSASWAIAGSSQALFFCEDMKRPQTIGRIIMISFFITVVLETSPVIGIVLGTHHPSALLGASAPFVSFLGEYLSDTWIKLVSLSIAIAIFNACLAGFVGNGRNLFSMGRSKLFAAPINAALMRLIPQTQAPWVAIILMGVTTALATFLSLKFKVLMLSGGFTMLTAFYVAAVFKGRRSGRLGHHSYKSPLYPLIPILGIFIVVGEVVVLWIDPESGRPSLFYVLGIYGLSLLYYRLVLCRRPQKWRVIGPEDIDGPYLAAE
jgi:amino acid transporter